jgi:aspartate/methionine/tyrosine aminotransferase
LPPHLPSLDPIAHRSLAERLDLLAIEGAFRTFAQARALEAQGHEVVHLELGEPDFPSPPAAVEAGVRAIHEGFTKYTAPQGLPELREALAVYARRRGVDATADEIVVTSGAKPMLQYALLAVVNPGDEVLVPDPGFPIYPSAVRFCGGTCRSYPIVLAKGGFRVDFDALASAITPRTRALVFNSPHNPTGYTASRADLEALGELVLRHDLWVVSDEIYNGLAYGDPGGESASFAAVPGLRDRTLIVDGFSKRYSMTGWRLGFGVVPRAAVEPVVNLLINNTSCTPPFVQKAGLAAVEAGPDFTARLRASLRERRDRFVGRLGAIPGIECALPPGAFYAFASVRALLARGGLTSDSFADLLLQQHGVACCTGTDFGANGEGFVRFSFATAAPKLERALELIGQAART